jgi:hypothetical protein
MFEDLINAIEDFRAGLSEVAQLPLDDRETMMFETLQDQLSVLQEWAEGEIQDSLVPEEELA